jgi:hypothetical protein
VHEIEPEIVARDPALSETHEDPTQPSPPGSDWNDQLCSSEHVEGNAPEDRVDDHYAQAEGAKKP